MPDLQNLLDQIDRLDQEATKGPWTATGDVYGGKVYEPSGYPLPGCTSCGENEATYQGQDAEFIALARTALPQLAKALRAVIDTHQKTEHQRRYGFPRADKWEHYCIEDDQSWPCATVQAITDALGADHAT